MEKLVILGTGNAQAIHCYNTCFALKQGDAYFLVDAGGGNGILSQLERAGIALTAIRHLFLSHTHSDHLLGAVWILRMVAAAQAQGQYEGDFHIYGHEECLKGLKTMAEITLQQKFVNRIGHTILFHELKDKQKETILAQEFTFFDIGSTKCKQFGFAMGNTLCFIGDEPYRPHEEGYAKNVRWLMHEAFCLYSQRDRFKPYEKHHATVKEACETAQALHCENLILYHTEDKNIENRKALYQTEGAPYFSGNLFVPDDLDTFTLKP